MKKALGAVLLVVLTLLAAASTALASTPSVGTDAQGSLGETASGGLPFTGLNLALIVIGGVVLLGTGIALRFRGSRDSG